MYLLREARTNNDIAAARGQICVGLETNELTSQNFGTTALAVGGDGGDPNRNLKKATNRPRAHRQRAKLAPMGTTKGEEVPDQQRRA